MKQEFLSRSEEETAAIGRQIAALLPRDGVVYLHGDLGAGKTALVRAIAVALGADPHEIASPTFAILHEYPLETGAALIHIDGYRLSNSRQEWLELGMDETLAQPGLKFIEWPRDAHARLVQKPIEITIEIREDDSRAITVED